MTITKLQNNIGMALILKTFPKFTPNDLAAIDQLLTDLGNDSLENYARIYTALNSGYDMASLNVEVIEELPIRVYVGDHMHEMAKAAAWELFEELNPELFAAFVKYPLDGLEFNERYFLNSPAISSEEHSFNYTKILIVTLN